jgi:hypothetical protein
MAVPDTQPHLREEVVEGLANHCLCRYAQRRKTTTKRATSALCPQLAKRLVAEAPTPRS